VTTIEIVAIVVLGPPAVLLWVLLMGMLIRLVRDIWRGDS
jgi:hypothetical protein